MRSVRDGIAAGRTVLHSLREPSSSLRALTGIDPNCRRTLRRSLIWQRHRDPDVRWDNETLIPPEPVSMPTRSSTTFMRHRSPVSAAEHTRHRNARRRTSGAALPSHRSERRASLIRPGRRPRSARHPLSGWHRSMLPAPASSSRPLRWTERPPRSQRARH